MVRTLPEDPGPPRPALDLGGYTQVTIVKTDEVDGHVYRRGQKPTVDGDTLKTLRDKGMVIDERPAG